MTHADVRTLALGFPEAEEQPHFDKASFRVKGKIFATLWEQPVAVLKLTADDADILSRQQPAVFKVTSWSHQGWVQVAIDQVAPRQFEDLLRQAWKNVAPKKLVAAWEAAN